MRTKTNKYGDFGTFFHWFITMRFQATIIFLLLLFGFSGIAFAFEPVIETLASPVSCHGKNDGSLSISVTNISSPHILIIINDQEKDTLYRSLDQPSEIEINNLTGGLKRIILKTGAKEVAFTNSLILEPKPLSGGQIKLETEPSSDSSCDAVLLAQPHGGNPPYSYLWSENAESSDHARVSNLCYGIYRCKINDSNFCGPVYISIPLLKHTIENLKQSKN